MFKKYATNNMKILPTSFLLMLLFFTSLGWAQNLDFESEIREEKSGDAIPGALVTIEGTVLAAKTDQSGAFKFDAPLPVGDFTVSVVKEGFENTYFLIKSEPDVRIVIDYVEMELTREEALRRKKEKITLDKEEKKFLKEAKKASKEKEKELAKQTKRLKRKNSVDVAYDRVVVDEPAPVSLPTSVPAVSRVGVDEDNGDEFYSDAQIKYSKILGVPLDKVSNKDLYNEIDKWMGTPYLYGGSTKNGIDCSAFSQLLLLKGFDIYIERTAETQYSSLNQYPFTLIDSLAEGDLLYFYKTDENGEEKISHVGVYLHNNKFVHSTGSKRNTGKNGVKISDITDPYWFKRFVSGGRRKSN